MGFKVINESFTCKHCGHENTPLEGSCRNHCTLCLYSLHVDKEYPGDRMSECHGLMKPTAIDQSNKKGFIIIHTCEKCNKSIRNKVATDDNQETLVKVASQIR